MTYNFGTQVFAGCAVRKTATQSINDGSGSGSNITFATGNGEEVYDTHGFHDMSTNPDRLTIPAGMAGKYRVAACTLYAADADGGRALSIKHFNSSDTQLFPQVNENQLTTGVGNFGGVNSSHTFDCSAADYFVVYTEHTAGAATDLLNAHTGFCIERVS